MMACVNCMSERSSVFMLCSSGIESTSRPFVIGRRTGRSITILKYVVLSKQVKLKILRLYQYAFQFNSFLHFLLQEMRKKPEALANRGGILLVYEKRMKELRKNLARIQQAIAAYVSTNSGSLYSLLHERFLNCSIPQISTHAFYV